MNRLNPSSVMDKSYEPTAKAGRRKRPDRSVARSTLARVAVSTMVTTAPGSTAPCASLTTPLTWAVLYCAKLARGASVSNAAHQTTSTAGAVGLGVFTSGSVVPFVWRAIVFV